MECQERLMALQEIAYNLLDLFEEAETTVISETYRSNRLAMERLDLDISEWEEEINDLVQTQQINLFMEILKTARNPVIIKIINTDLKSYKAIKKLIEKGR